MVVLWRDRGGAVGGAEGGDVGGVVEAGRRRALWLGLVIYVLRHRLCLRLWLWLRLQLRGELLLWLRHVIRVRPLVSRWLVVMRVMEPSLLLVG